MYDNPGAEKVQQETVLGQEESMDYAKGKRFVISWNDDWPVTVSYPAGLVRAAGQVGDVDAYYPKRFSDRDRQVSCHCMCHEAGPAEHEGKCPCKIGGFHTLYWD